MTNLQSDSVGISLGSDCEAAVFGVNQKLRKTKKEGYATCPFDQTLSPLPGVIQCLKDDFKYFMDDTYLVLEERHGPVPSLGPHLFIHNTKYNFFWPHESPADFALYEQEDERNEINYYIDNNFAMLKKRYTDRANNFRNYIQSALKYGSEIVFILSRFNTEICELDNCIRNLYQGLNYRIIRIDVNKTREDWRHFLSVAGLTESEINIEIP